MPTLNRRVYWGLSSATLIALILSAAYLARAEQPVTNAAAQTDSYADGELLVKFEPGASAEGILELHRQAGGRAVREIPALGVHVVSVGAGQAAGKLAVYQRNPNVEYAELNTIYRALDDPYYPTQWALNNSGQLGGTPDADIDAPEAWPVSSGSGVKIAVLDTGIRKSHEEVTPSRVVLEKNFSSSPTSEDNHGHGTHVSTTAAGLTGNGLGIQAVAPGALLMNGKVLNDSGSGTCDGVANGITWAADNGAQVINMSLGGGGCQTMENAVNYAWNADVVLACAAGNNNTTALSYPAAYSNCIAVAATDNNDQRASFSNYGSWVEVAAPGVRIAAGVAPAAEVGTGHLGLLHITSARNLERDAQPLVYSETTPGSGIEAAAVFAGPGDVSDFNSIDCGGKIAVIQRGSSTFATKVTNAKADGCIGAVIYNNVAGNINGTLGAAGDWLPTLSISQADGEDLVSWINAGPTTLRIVIRNDYAEWSGTSMATPHVAGTAALVWAVCPGSSAAGVRNRIESTADAIPGTGSFWTQGRINAANAVSGCAAGPTATPAPTPSPTPTPSCAAPVISSSSDSIPAGGGTVTFAWNAVPGATEYKVQRQKGASWSTRLTTGGTSFSGGDHPSDPLWRVLVSAGSCAPIPGPATVFDP